MSVFCHTQIQTNTSAPLKRPVGQKTECCVSVCWPHNGSKFVMNSIGMFLTRKQTGLNSATLGVRSRLILSNWHSKKWLKNVTDKEMCIHSSIGPFWVILNDFSNFILKKSLHWLQAENNNFKGQNSLAVQFHWQKKSSYVRYDTSIFQKTAKYVEI